MMEDQPDLDRAIRDLFNEIVDALHVPLLVDWLNQNRVVIWLADTRIVRWLNRPEMSTPALLTRTDRWVVVTRRPVYAVPAGDSYYLRAQQVEHDNPRHLRVVEFVVAPPEDPALDW